MSKAESKESIEKIDNNWISVEYKGNIHSHESFQIIMIISGMFLIENKSENINANMTSSGIRHFSNGLSFSIFTLNLSAPAERKI